MSNSIQRKLSKDLEKIERQLSSPDSPKSGNFIGRMVRKLDLACTKLEFLFKTGRWQSKASIGRHVTKTSMKHLTKDWAAHYNKLKSEKNAKIDRRVGEFLEFNKIVEENIVVISKIIDLIKTKSSDEKTLNYLNQMEKRIDSYKEFLKSISRLEPANLSTLQQKVHDQRDVFFPDKALLEEPLHMETSDLISEDSQKSQQDSLGFLEEMSVEEQTGQEFIEALKNSASQRERNWKYYKIQTNSSPENSIIEELTEEEEAEEPSKSFTGDEGLERAARDLALDELEKNYQNDMQIEELTEEEIVVDQPLEPEESLEQMEKRLFSDDQEKFLDDLQKKYERELEEES